MDNISINVPSNDADIPKFPCSMAYIGNVPESWSWDNSSRDENEIMVRIIGPSDLVWEYLTGPGYGAPVLEVQKLFNRLNIDIPER